MWLESGAPYAGSYAGLRNAEDQAKDFGAVATVFIEGNEILRRRCGECHAIGDHQNEDGKALPFQPNITHNARGTGRRIGIHERVVLEDDPLAKYSQNILVNLTRPALSPLLLAPLAAESGGWGSCGNVFTGTDDADYQKLLSISQRAKAKADVRPRYATPGFRPNHQYIREMKKYGVLPPDFDAATSPIDIFQADQDYWRSFWHSTE